GIDLEVIGAAVLADDHPFIDWDAGIDHQLAALFEIPERIGNAGAVGVGDEDAIATSVDIALERLIAVKEAAHDTGAAGVGQEFAVIADEATRRHQHDQAGLGT